MAGEIAISLVEGKAHEAALVVFAEPPGGLVEGDDVETFFLDLIEHGVEKFGSDFEAAVRREALICNRPHLVERKDHAGALRIGRKQTMRAQMVEPGHGRPGHGALHSHHADLLKSQRRSALCS